MKTSIPLLIASDDLDDVDNVYRLVKPNFTNKGTATEASGGAEFITGLESCVIALCLRTIEGSREFYTDLLRYAIHNRPIRHRTILLCTTGEVREACLAAMRGKFDDFAVIKPLTDPCVVRFRIYRQARALETEARYKQALSEHHLRQSRRITDQAFDRMHEEQGELRAQAQERHDTLHRQINRKLDAFESSLKDGEMADTVKVLDEDKLGAHFSNLVENDLTTELQQFRTSLTESLDTLLERYRQIREKTHGALNDLVPQSKPPLSVLVVDDEPEVNDMLREMLEEEGHQVLQAFDGDSGFFEAVHHGPDLLLIDINLPKLNGIQLCQKLRAHTKTRHLPIIIVTGNATRKVVDSGRRVGVRQLLVKPFTFETLQEKVGLAMAEKKPGQTAH